MLAGDERDIEMGIYTQDTHVHAHMHAHTHMRIDTRMHAHMHTPIRTNTTRAHAHALACTHAHTRAHTHARTRMHTRVHAHMHTYITHVFLLVAFFSIGICAQYLTFACPSSGSSAGEHMSAENIVQASQSTVQVGSGAIFKLDFDKSKKAWLVRARHIALHTEALCILVNLCERPLRKALTTQEILALDEQHNRVISMHTSDDTAQRKWAEHESQKVFCT